MSCDAFDLDALVHGTVQGDEPEGERRAAEAHAGQCATCRRELELFRAERALFAQRAARHAVVPHELWQAVAARTTAASQARVPRGWLARWMPVGFGLAAATAVLAMMLVREPARRQAPPRGPAGRATPPAATVEPPAPVVLAQAEEEYRQIVGTLERAYAARRARLGPAAAHRHEASFGELRALIDRERAAAGEDVAGRRRVLRAYARYASSMRNVVLAVSEENRSWTHD